MGSEVWSSFHQLYNTIRQDRHPWCTSPLNDTGQISGSPSHHCRSVMVLSHTYILGSIATMSAHLQQSKKARRMERRDNPSRFDPHTQVLKRNGTSASLMLKEMSTWQNTPITWGQNMDPGEDSMVVDQGFASHRSSRMYKTEDNLCRMLMTLEPRCPNKPTFDSMSIDLEWIYTTIIIPRCEQPFVLKSCFLFTTWLFKFTTASFASLHSPYCNTQYMGTPGYHFLYLDGYAWIVPRKCHKELSATLAITNATQTLSYVIGSTHGSCRSREGLSRAKSSEGIRIWAFHDSEIENRH